VDDTTWEFKLRPGVTFHDGSNLTADDIAFTVAHVRNVLNSLGGFGCPAAATTLPRIRT
jgi:peptide/nickel transport system substrate-binding protein